MFDVTQAPVQDVCSAPFWTGLCQQRLLIQRCANTGKYQWYPRAHSLHDPGAAPVWVQAAGRGRVYSHTTINRGGVQQAPYTCVLVELEEGPLILAHWHDDSARDAAIGMHVQAGFVTVSDALTLLVFSPRES